MLRWIYLATMVGLAILVCVLILPHAVMTNDGPAHLAFANRLATAIEPNHPLQEQAFRIHLQPNPNLAVYLLMAALIRLFSPGIAESVVQVLCILAPMAAGFFALRQIERGSGWLAVLILPLSLNQMFFLGLYNHGFSIAAFFLAIGAYYWMLKAPSYRRAVWVAAGLVLAFLCHASGFIMAYAGIGTMAATLFLLALMRKETLRAAIRQQRFALVALGVPLPLAAVFLSSAGKGSTRYGLELGARLKQFGTLRELAVNLPRDKYVGLLLSSILLAGVIYAAWRILGRHVSESPERQDQALGTLAAAVVSALIMMAFPDTMGGGWTHFRRFEVFPYFWVLLLLAYNAIPREAIGALFAAGAGAALLLLTSMAGRQSLVREQMAPMLEVDGRVGSHCSVLPIVLKRVPSDASGNPEWMRYSPYFQAASRMELSNDRVVLFNFLARLDLYPVRFRPGIEPQAGIFHWAPQQPEMEIDTIDVSGYEKSSAMRVDYIFLWGSLDAAPTGLKEQFLSAVRPFHEVYASADGVATLYARNGQGNAVCLRTDEAPKSAALLGWSKPGN